MRENKEADESRIAIEGALMFLFGENIEVFVKNELSFLKNYETIE